MAVARPARAGGAPCRGCCRHGASAQHPWEALLLAWGAGPGVTVLPVQPFRDLHSGARRHEELGRRGLRLPFFLHPWPCGPHFIRCHLPSQGPRRTHSTQEDSCLVRWDRCPHRRCAQSQLVEVAALLTCAPASPRGPVPEEHPFLSRREGERPERGAERAQRPLQAGKHDDRLLLEAG